MFDYPGGSAYALGSHKYRFIESFFSDLGATNTAAGYSNVSSYVLYVIAMVCVGASLIAFSDSWQGVAARRGIRVTTGWIYKWCATASGVCCIAIAATPWNYVPSLHTALVRAGFALLAAFIVTMVAVQLRNRWPWHYVGANVLFMIILGVYVLIQLAGTNVDTHSGLVFQVVAQKVMVYSAILNLGYQAHGVHNVLVPSRRPAFRLAHH